MNFPVPYRANIVERDLIAEVRHAAPDRIEGFVYDARDLAMRFVVELYLDGGPAPSRGRTSLTPPVAPRPRRRLLPLLFPC